MSDDEPPPPVREHPLATENRRLVAANEALTAQTRAMAAELARLEREQAERRHRDRLAARKRAALDPGAQSAFQRPYDGR